MHLAWLGMTARANSVLCFLCNKHFTVVSVGGCMLPAKTKKKNKRKKKKRANWPGAGSMVVGLEWSVYLLITATLVHWWEGCLPATLLGSAVWTKWVWVIGPVQTRKQLQTLQKSDCGTIHCMCAYVKAFVLFANHQLQNCGGIECHWSTLYLKSIHSLHL